MDIAQLAAQADECINKSAGKGAELASPLPGLVLLRHPRPTPLSATLYEPVVCLILQGEKETAAGETRLRFGPGESLVVSHVLPVVSRITQASPASPYLALVLSLDVALLRSLYDEVGPAAVETPRAQAMDVHPADPRLVDALSRYLALADDALEQRVVGPLLLRELHFRLLVAPHGGMLRRLLRHDSHASGIERALARLRRDFREPIAVPALAQAVGMSPSSFHKHFKAVTSTTPLQYQKELRLLEARRLLSVEGRSVSSAAFEVGYESANQFSREYARKFGVAPRTDLGAARAA